MVELIDVYRRDGFFLYSKGKRLAHLQGEWHKSIHVWAFCKMNGEIFQVFSRRAQGKSYSGLLDCSVAGHLKEGESIGDGTREIKEEIGLSVSFSSLEFVGLRRVEYPMQRGINREFQYVFLLELESFSKIKLPNYKEVDAIVAIKAQDIISLYNGKKSKITAKYITDDPSVIKPKKFTRNDFFPSEDGYYEAMSLHLIRNGLHVLPDTFISPLTLLDYCEIGNINLLDVFLENISYSPIAFELAHIFRMPSLRRRLFRALFFSNLRSKKLSFFIEQVINGNPQGDNSIQFIYLIGWISDSNNTESLKRLMQNSNEKIREAATFVYGEVCSVNGLENLAIQIQDPDDSVCAAAAFSLGWNQGAKRFELLKKHNKVATQRNEHKRKKIIESALRMFEV